MSIALRYAFAAAGTVIAVFTLAMCIRGYKKYGDISQAADRDYILLPCFIHIGCCILAFFRSVPGENLPSVKSFFSKPDGPEKGSFLYYCFCSSSLSLAFLIIPLIMFLISLTGEPLLILTAAAVPLLPALYMIFEIKRKIKEKDHAVLSDIPAVISKLTLLIGAGTVLREAWDITSRTSDRPLFLEMREASLRMKNGMSEEDALYRFSQRCGIREARQLASVITQNLKKGSGELSTSLRYLGGECWAEKKNRAVVEGKKAEGRLLVPLMMMFIGILLIIIVPLFSGLI